MFKWLIKEINRITVQTIILDSEQKKYLSPLVISIILAILTISILIFTSRDIGITWDEPTYILATENHMGWFKEIILQPNYALSSQGIINYWERNHETPPFDKIWSGIFWLISKDLIDDLTAHRLGNIFLTGILVALIYTMVNKYYGTLAGLVSVAALILMPRFFFHAHLAALDVPIAIMIFTVGFVYVTRADRLDLKWTLLLGILFGFALATKINALIILPLLLSIWTIIFKKRRFFLFSRLLIMGLIGSMVFVAFWPWLYRDTFSRLLDYVNFMTVGHYKITQYYHGWLFSPPRWHFPFVMTLLVIPLSITVLYFIGSLTAFKAWRTKEITWYFIIGALLPLLIFSIGISTVFDNERLFMSTFPYLAVLAGIGFDRVAQWLKRMTTSIGNPNFYRFILIIVIIITFLPHTLVSIQLYPHLLSYYSELVGGLPGASKIGMETTYWCETYQDALDYLNRNVPFRSVVWAECYDVLLYYQSYGKLRSDIRIAGGENPKPVYDKVAVLDADINKADYAVVQYRQSGFYHRIVSWLDEREPIFSEDFKGIPLIRIYQH